MGTLTPLRVVIAEDEPLARTRLRRLLEEAGCVVVAAFEEGGPLLDWLRLGEPVDALFLDIQMPGGSGLEVAAELPVPLPVVFVTALREHALAAFELSALDYILKPVSAERLAKAIARLREGSNGARSGAEFKAALLSGPRVVIRAGDGLVFLDLKKVTHFEVVEDAVHAWSGGQRLATQWRTLAEVEDLFAGSALVRIQRHLLVRPECILGLRPLAGNRSLALLERGLELEVSRAATAQLKLLLGIKGEFGKRDS